MVYTTILPNSQLNELVATSQAASREIEVLKARIKEQKDSINAKHKELRAKIHRKEKLLKKNDDLTLQIKKKETEMEKIRNDNRTGYDRISKLESEYKWIVTDREFFGVKNTKYDYSKEKPEEAGEKLREAKAKQAKMEKRINLKAMVLLEREEEKLKEVHSRKLIVENDRKKIKSILKGLDDEKTEQVRVAWKEVDKNFGSIFTVLLPGAQASLVPSAGGDFFQGLSIKVGFNGVWKESLNELSGGQRSLVALSLILAMLKFKPAPIYILDEVDAALDMSHTQNIGNMLKLHFTNSQVTVLSIHWVGHWVRTVSQCSWCSIFLFSVYYCFAEGWYVQQRKRFVQDEIREWCVGHHTHFQCAPLETVIIFHCLIYADVIIELLLRRLNGYRNCNESKIAE